MSQTHPTNEPKDVEGELRKQVNNIIWGGMNRERQVIEVCNLLRSTQARTHTDTIATIRAKLPKDALAVRQDWQGLNWLDGCNDVINLVNALLTRLEKEVKDNL
jgi:hypothetical protein